MSDPTRAQLQQTRGMSSTRFLKQKDAKACAQGGTWGLPRQTRHEGVGCRRSIAKGSKPPTQVVRYAMLELHHAGSWPGPLALYSSIRELDECYQMKCFESFGQLGTFGP